MLKKLLGNIEEKTITFNGNEVDYVTFGRGEKPLVIIPGLGDGLRTVKGTGIILWFIYRIFTRDYKVYIFSRKNNLQPGYTTRDMAADLAEVVKHFKISPAAVIGLSQGGMIAQWLAIDYPEIVNKLVLTITLARQNETIQQVIGEWIRLAEEELYDELAVDTMEKSQTEQYLKKVRPFYWFVKRTSKPQSKERFLIQAESCRNHDAFANLPQIQAPTFVIGGGADNIVGGSEVQHEIAESIPNSQLYIYENLGHGAFMEAKDFNMRIYRFLTETQF